MRKFELAIGLTVLRKKVLIRIDTQCMKSTYFRNYREYKEEMPQSIGGEKWKW